MSRDLDTVIARYLDRQADPDEVVWLDARLRDDPEARRHFVTLSATVGLLADALKGESRGRTNRPVLAIPPRSPWKPWAIASALLAACLAIAVHLFTGGREEQGPRIESVEGTVAVLRGGDRLAAGVGTMLQSGDRIDSGAGRVGLVWGGHIHATLAAASAVSPQGDPASHRLALLQGRVDLAITGGGATASPITIEAGSWSIQDIGTVFSVSLDRDGPQVAVTTGAVVVHDKVHDQVQELRLGPGEGAEADGVGAPRKASPHAAFGSATRPFAADSPWNLPLVPGAVRQALPADALRGLDWTTTYDRIARVAGVTGRTTILRLTGGSLETIDCALPPSLKALRPTDFLILTGPDGGRMWELHGASLLSTGELMADRLEDVDLHGPGTSGMLLSGLPLCGGMILVPEADSALRHVIALHLSAAVCSAAGIALGDRLALAEDDDAVASPDRRRHDLARALRDYGAMVVANVNNSAQISVDPDLPAEIRDAISQTMAGLAPRLKRIAAH